MPLDATLREELLQVFKPQDAFGNPMPNRMSLFTLLGVAVGAGVRCKPVPDDYWRQASDFQKRPQAVVDCPCGQLVIVELAIELVKCHGCERWYFYAGPELMVLNSPLAVLGSPDA